MVSILLLSRPRSIPAYAGDPNTPPRNSRISGVYPRLRGGSRGGRARALYAHGLSPPTRGIRVVGDVNQHLVGSIPAYAGDPPSAPPLPQACRVYPRLRGGSSSRSRARAGHRGLSPPTRGIHGVYVKQLPLPGSIPAYAGDPIRDYSHWQVIPVYPRLRGGSFLCVRRR